MKTLVAIIAVLVAFGSGASVQVQSPETEQSLFVSVIRRGEPVLDLTADEFVVEEDGERRDVLRIERAEEPMHVAILVDDSRGLVQNLSHIRNGLNELLDALPEGQQIALLTFGGDQVRTIVDYTSDKGRLREEVTRYAAFSESSAYLMNALAGTAIDLDQRGALRPVIILITGEDAITGGGSTLGRSVELLGLRGLDAAQALGVLKERMVAVHSLILRGVRDNFAVADGFAQPRQVETNAPGVIGPASPRGGVDPNRGVPRLDAGARERARLFEQLPKVTGGIREELGNSSAVPKVLGQIANDISNQYLVTYARPVGLAPADELEVSVTRRRHRVRSTLARPSGVR